MPPTRFPVSAYYAAHVLEGITLSNKGGWWTAVLLIADPRTKSPFVSLYRWELDNGEWKNRKSFVIRDQGTLDKVIAGLQEYRGQLPAKSR
jgi:hypothetical protein